MVARNRPHRCVGRRRPGWVIDQIDATVGGWLRSTTPRTVLLHIGTNDILQNYNVAGAPSRLSGLVDHITAAAPSADVFVAMIIPLANAGAAGRRVHLVDMHAALTKMAATWYAALRSVPGAIGDPGTGTALVGSASGRCLDIPNGSTANGAAVILWTCTDAPHQNWTRR